MTTRVMWFQDLGLGDIDQVGGKNASLGEMVSSLAHAGVKVPGGFATTASAYQEFLEETGLRKRIDQHLEGLDVEDTRALTEVGAAIRADIAGQAFPAALEAEIRTAYETLVAEHPEASFAVRSSATAEDLPDASFAGQQETFLNISGIENVLTAIRDVFASLYNDRAIAYRVHHGFNHADVLLSAGIQVMVRSDIGASGVMFTMDTESGFRDAIFITSSFGLGEAVVQGAVNPDEFYVYKPALAAGRHAILKRGLGEKATRMVYTQSKEVGRTTVFEPVPAEMRRQFSLTDADVTQLARYAQSIEDHYGRPMDIEWGKDGLSGDLFVLQARPETVQSRAGAASQRYLLRGEGTVILEGRAIGQRIGSGRVRVLSSLEQMHDFKAGDVLVADMTDPDWEPIMKRASAIVTNRGGRTCHAAIIARELGIPAVVGTEVATVKLHEGDAVTVSCAQGETGFIYRGEIDFEVESHELGVMPEPPCKVMMNVGTPDQAFAFAQLPHAGIGLARLEFIINRQIGVHPKALLHLDEQPASVQDLVRPLISAYADPRTFFVQKLVEGISTLAAAFAPEPVIVRLSDFKSNEYYNLIGGAEFEPHEENPMLGFRGASRYIDEGFRECFEMECEALRFVREDMGLTNVKVMVPFVRTLDEAAKVIDLLGRNGLVRGERGLEVYMMCELPVNALLADQFLAFFDGFSIGSNDMTQLTLGMDRDSGLVAQGFDERNDAVKALLSMAIEAGKRAGKYVGICGQGPSDHPDFAQWLVEQGISSVSLNPDTVVDTWMRLADAATTGPSVS
ncbi:phosphoenolpyruvate synthase [Micrococcales bacterium 31B]|nr:phosphoenolpyruvate synthase [Micrococcales bacterium 31B]